MRLLPLHSADMHSRVQRSVGEPIDVLWEGAGTEWDPDLVELLHSIVLEGVEAGQGTVVLEPRGSD